MMLPAFSKAIDYTIRFVHDIERAAKRRLLNVLSFYFHSIDEIPLPTNAIHVIQLSVIIIVII